MFCLSFLFCLFLSLNAYGQNSFAPVVKQVMPSVVNISTEIIDHTDDEDIQNDLIFTSDGHVSLGSGVIVDDKGYVLTNVHVIEKAKEIRVTTSDGKTYRAELKGKDDLLDVALLTIETDAPFKAVSFADSDQVEVGDWVVAIGNPFGLSNSVTAGIVSAVSRRINETPFDDYIQTDAPINPGNSGGPMFNLKGEVIGLNTLIFSKQGNSVGVGFAIPSNQLKPIFEALKSKGKVERASLGVELKETTYENMPALIVTAVKNEDLLKNNVLEVGDIILSYDGKAVSDKHTFRTALSWMEVGKEVHLELICNGKKETRDVALSLYQNPAKPTFFHQADEAKGIYYSKLKLRLQNGMVTSVDEKSEANLKGIQTGDKIKAVNGHPLQSDQDMELYIKESDDLKKNIRLDMEDAKGEPYFAELKLSES